MLYCYGLLAAAGLKACNLEYLLPLLLLMILQDLAGSVHLDVLASSVPHGFMRGKLFDMLSDQRVALPRAVWFIQVAYLNRTK